MSGTFLGMQAEIQDIICQAEQEFAPLEIFLCGGEADLFVNRFAQKVKLKPHLILKGLYRILNYQRNKSYLETVIGIPKIQS